MKQVKCLGTIMDVGPGFARCLYCEDYPGPLTPYQLHAQNQLHAGSSVARAFHRPEVIGFSASETHYSDSSTHYITISESAARAIVAAIDDNRPHRAAHLIKELPWFAEILSGVRATRHLKPESYIRLSERPMRMIESVDAVRSDGCKIGLTTFRQIP